jgi:MoxR-like ATPase
LSKEIDELFDPRVRKRPSAPVPPPASLRARQDLPQDYIASKDLLQAAKVAWLLRKPLLLTGPAGTGKTQMAYHLHWRLGYRGQVLKFETKSTSTGRDLFYTYNVLARFESAYGGKGSQDPLPYIHYNALGEAFLRTRPKKYTLRFLAYQLDPPHEEPESSVVLIDEIDKAPTDFPNDILNEVDQHYFRIPELKNEAVEADKNLAPLVVLTSNSEKTLPAPFLRRCAFFHIDFPTKEELRVIAAARIPDFSNVTAVYPLLRDGLELFQQIRNLDLDHKPATGEFLDWLLVLLRDFGPQGDLRGNPQKLYNSLGTLGKGMVEQGKVKSQVDLWLKPKSNSQPA